MLSFVFRVCALAIFLSVAIDAAAAEDPPPSPQTELDALFERLASTEDEGIGRVFARRIEREWMVSGSATVDLFMRWGIEAMAGENYGAALDFLDQAVLLDPDFPEAYNRRATAYFLAGNMAASIADVERTLALEPRHFNALAGLGLIMEQIGEPERAFEAYRRVLELYPAQDNVQERFETLRLEVEGRPI